MIFVLSDVIEKTIISDMKKADHYDLMLDKTTDSTVTEQTAIHGRFIAKDSGKLRCHFLKIIDVLKPELDRVSDTASPIAVNVSVPAETLTKRVYECVKAVGLDPEKMRGIGTVGAATMTGRLSGVVTRLKELATSPVSGHCAAHRLNLAASQAAIAVPYFKKSTTLQYTANLRCLRQQCSTAGLEAIKSPLHETRALAAPCATRWLSIDKSVRKLNPPFAP